MKNIQIRKLKGFRQFESKQPSVENIGGNEVIRNDWKEFIAQNDLFEPEILIRADDSLSLLADEGTSIDEAYSIVLVGCEPVNDGAEIGWVDIG
jgi:hypothetical protein